MLVVKLIDCCIIHWLLLRGEAVEGPRAASRWAPNGITHLWRVEYPKSSEVVRMFAKWARLNSWQDAVTSIHCWWKTAHGCRLADGCAKRREQQNYANISLLHFPRVERHKESSLTSSSAPSGLPWHTSNQARFSCGVSSSKVEPR